MKTVCIYHSIDLDGWMSAAIVKHWFIETNKPNNYVIDGIETARGGNPHNPNHLNFIGYNYGQPIPDLSGYDKVIMCDISFPKDEMGKLLTKLNGNLIWIDHHISAINDNKELMSINILYGLRDTKYAACELTWKYFFPNNQIPEIVRLLGRYDCFGHKGTDEETKVLEFQYGARSCISDYKEAYYWLKDSINNTNTVSPEKYIHNKGISIYQYLCSEAKQTYKNGFEIFFNIEVPIVDLEELFISSKETKDIQYSFICINKERFNPINFGIDYHKEGYDGCACFHYANGMWNFSLYNDNGRVDCSSIAKQYGGGGHKGAAGFKINNINEIIKYE